jgi:hypothetical protein
MRVSLVSRNVVAAAVADVIVIADATMDGGPVLLEVTGLRLRIRLTQELISLALPA